MTDQPAAIDPTLFRHVLGHYPTGVCVVTALQPDGSKAGMVVGSFTSVSLDPPLVGFFPDKKSSTWPRIEQAGRFAVNVLDSEQGEACRQLAARSDDKFVGVAHSVGETGHIRLDGVVAVIECDLYAVHEAGDHYFVLGRVTALDAAPEKSPMLFCRGGYGRFHQPE